MGGPALSESEEWIEDAEEGKEGKKRELYLVCKNEKKMCFKIWSHILILAYE